MMDSQLVEDYFSVDGSERPASISLAYDVLKLALGECRFYFLLEKPSRLSNFEVSAKVGKIWSALAFTAIELPKELAIP